MKKCFIWLGLVIFLLPSVLRAAPVPSDMQGTWGIAFFSRDLGGQWTAEGGKAEFKPDGTGNIEMYHGDSKGNTSVPPPGGSPFTYSSASNPDGTLTLHINLGSSTETFFMIFSDSKDMILLDGTRNPTFQRIGVFSRVDPAGGYGDTDILGNGYFGIGYELGISTPPSYSSLSFDVASATLGDLSGDARENTDGIPGLQSTVSSPYHVNTDGLILMFNIQWPEQGYISKNKNVLLYYQIRATALGTYLFMKKNDKTYSTPDLAGKFILVGIGGMMKGSLEKISASIGSLACETNGHCNFALKIQTNGLVEYETSSFNFSLNQDGSGSFGESIGSGYPAYGAALGNGGNTLIVNPSLPDHPTVPEIFIGVRCSDCIYPFSVSMPLVLRN